LTIRIFAFFGILWGVGYLAVFDFVFDRFWFLLAFRFGSVPFLIF